MGAAMGYSSARGTMNAQGGRTLVGELGRELVVSNGRYYTVGDRGAEFVNLKKGDIVFNHVDTEQILGKSIKTNRGQAFASGTSITTLIKNLLTGNVAATKTANASISSSNSATAKQNAAKAEDIAYKKQASRTAEEIAAAIKEEKKYTTPPPPPPSGGETDLYGSGGNGSGGGRGSEEAKNAFEEQYKKHQHLLEMNQEEMAEYLDWLESAYKDAFTEGSEEYWKY